MLTSVLAISVGASAGACLRWWLSPLNGLFTFLPAGTLVANLLGCYLAGIVVSLFTLLPTLQPEWRLLIMTGFLGALTTFSAFSVEIVFLLQHGRIVWAVATIAANLCGSLLMTLLGMGSVVLASRIF